MPSGGLGLSNRQDKVLPRRLNRRKGYRNGHLRGHSIIKRANNDKVSTSTGYDDSLKRIRITLKTRITTRLNVTLGTLRRRTSLRTRRQTRRIGRTITLVQNSATDLGIALMHMAVHSTPINRHLSTTRGSKLRIRGLGTRTLMSLRYRAHQVNAINGRAQNYVRHNNVNILMLRATNVNGRTARRTNHGTVAYSGTTVIRRTISSRNANYDFSTPRTRLNGLLTHQVIVRTRRVLKTAGRLNKVVRALSSQCIRQSRRIQVTNVHEYQCRTVKTFRGTMSTQGQIVVYRRRNGILIKRGLRGQRTRARRKTRNITVKEDISQGHGKKHALSRLRSTSLGVYELTQNRINKVDRLGLPPKQRPLSSDHPHPFQSRT